VSLPLAGIRVLDLSRLLPGGFCSLLLADFGAEVLKVEDTGMGDYIRWAPPYYEGAEESARSALFLALNRNKRSIRIDLKSERGREVLLRLVAQYDVVLESFRPGVLDRLGVGYEQMRAVNPGIVYCAISGYGQDGPKRAAAGHDMNYLALVGLLGLTGERDGAGQGEAGGHGEAGNASGVVGGVGGHPIQSAGQIADLGGGAMMAAFGILAALRERDGGSNNPGSGEGQVVDVSMADGALSWLALVAGRYFAEQVVPHRGGLELAGSLICYRPYECADGWVALGALEPKFWQTWCRGVEREDLVERQFDGPGSDAHAQVCDIFKARTRAQWEEFARQYDCCLEPVLDLDEALDSELVRAREMVVDIEQPGVAGGVRQLGLPVKLTRTPGHHAQRPGPALGEHTAEVLREAGCSAQEIEELLQVGAVAGPAQAQAGEATGFRA
jgi:alpha-methylacyl-CoA racemase